MGAPAGFLKEWQQADEMTCERAINVIYACAGKHDIHKGEDPLDPALCEELDQVRDGHIFGPGGVVRCNACYAQLLNLGHRFNPGTI